ncbi:hypothetical protein CWB99_08515 [Pseudoalteromonas rubra]|uniref:DUF676 domain-containing protein n=1 Tax=Pseudoalteromonas rubra TaxID=43658 RepID=A0A5S3WNP7_9GAMM|nr:hypothetical protein [Pseudoalteromonas rubra]TMP29634.1 hypothetical protein CWB99_08515 [Pseudoalteromonas rubra]TMP35227.1 hypothetical protein CWC00_05480 [Pseudoalteromonas rubra]
MFNPLIKSATSVTAALMLYGIANANEAVLSDVPAWTDPEPCPVAPLEAAQGETSGQVLRRSPDALMPMQRNCDDFNPPPTRTRFDSGYTVYPNRSFTTDVTRYRYVCIRWRWDDEQPLGVDKPVLYSDGLELGASDIVPQEGGFRICEEYASRPFTETGGHISIRYGNDKRLNKPIVLVQGYNFDMRGFTPNRVPIEREVLDNFSRYSKLYESRFRHAFNSGYDLVVFRYAKQDDGVRHNAKALAAALKTLAAQSSEIRLVGHSMGGVAGRLALGYLEKEGFNHKVKNFVAVDAPFRGVHMPADVISFAYEIENQANKMRCGVRYPFSGSKRSECRRERDRLRSIKDIFTSTTFKDLHEGSAANNTLRNHIRSLDNYFAYMSGTDTTAISYGSDDGRSIPGVYTGNRSLDLKVDIQWHLSGGRHSRLYSSARSDDNGSYIQLYHQISREMDKAPSWAIGYDRGILLGDWTTGRMSFVTSASAFDGHIFEETKYYTSEHNDHRLIFFKINDLKL